jgi:hypothetical protein
LVEKQGIDLLIASLLIAVGAGAKDQRFEKGTMMSANANAKLEWPVGPTPLELKIARQAYWEGHVRLLFMQRDMKWALERYAADVEGRWEAALAKYWRNRRLEENRASRRLTVVRS